MANGMVAKLVWDGTDKVRIPEEMGVPRPDQMQGTTGEQLAEISGRVCYDSMGTPKSRPSFDDRIITGVDPHTGEQLFEDVEGYHSHILGVNHGSVNEHYHFTIEITFPRTPEGRHQRSLCGCLCLNRPGVIALPCDEHQGLRITVNPLSVRQWDDWFQRFYGPQSDEHALNWQLRCALHYVGHTLAPHIIPDATIPPEPVLGMLDVAPVAPINEHEKWVSLFMQGSRGFSHEQVRHGDFTAISQRSTRFCDETETPWVMHPLINAYVNERAKTDKDLACGGGLLHDYDVFMDGARKVYAETVERLQPWLMARGVDKTNARKQARGAARGFLGNALQTEMIFSASVWQWKNMLAQRAAGPADGEIRQIYVAEDACVIAALKESRYADSFENYHLEPAPDGIGHVVVVKNG